MDIRYCPECGKRLDEDSLFCTNCGFKVGDENKKTRYCSNCGEKIDLNNEFCSSCGFKVRDEIKKTRYCSSCGEKIDFNAEICPKCGVRVQYPLVNSAREKIKRNANKADNFLVKYVTYRNVLIILLVFIIIGLVVAAPSIINYLTPYKEVGSDYIADPVAGEKVQFDGEYMGHTSWGGGYLFYLSITNNDIVKVGDQYVIIQGDYLSHDLYGKEGKTIHLEGRFAEGGLSKQRFGDGYIEGHWFGAHTIEIVN
ncbi:zinc ribbon domain-containing protein [Methanobrevibacter sp.]|uniref:zinc ribbon domain-containing protein n=1 Tax=Methanobrevibacter sp. TaxID=66852 RepID=UPI0026DF1636|nr:zinc ribbon domain-containing protein [Methanobrevibacter sp.]MDO5859875.1 zinc ribbon domain-containing protein [Methanobrevibacter sp.]